MKYLITKYKGKHSGNWIYSSRPVADQIAAMFPVGSQVQFGCDSPDRGVVAVVTSEERRAKLEEIEEKMREEFEEELPELADEEWIGSFRPEPQYDEDDELIEP